MRSLFRTWIVALAGLLVFTARASAQVTETQIPFDSAGKVRSLTPALVTRYQLVPPAWPVTGDFVEARLYSVSTGGLILAVDRRSGSVERYPLTPEAARQLGSAIEAALARTGAAVAEAQPEVNASPARNAFVRNQMILSWVLYGPLLASLANDSRTASALYLLSISSSYFVTSAIGRKLNVTRAQNLLATDGAFRGWGAVSGLLYAAGGDSVDGKVYRGLGLVGALGGAAVGLAHGRGLTDGEAKAATTGSSFAAITTFGLAGTFGILNDHDTTNANLRPTVGAAVGAGVVGYLLGPRYARTAGYAVTKGDIQLLWLTATLGTMAATTPIVDSDPNAQLGWGLATAGFLGGIVIGDRVLVRRYDHTTSDAAQIWLGALAGSLAGSAVSVMTQPGPTATMALVTAGGIAGTVLGLRMAAPAPAGMRRQPVAPSGESGNAALELNPMGLAFSAMRVPGQHPLVTLRF